ncbi:AI-2E family transporter [Pollutimonas thiosulfatoxidans]|uniref:AI-2E family transporter n=1 Tax=Pollutimonas thiosulfatoxidans TaxID=2028345 RepID=A0A410G991_9BURK|nr:AI-2E family transporter [Pollutimonas thiosulfatoxidans]MBF6615247.1 AI-2E family transporter [Candidimonas sp.]QAA92879.1 AI-2E family transporter [Pollutimonas thiosulfatoxidans]
MDATQNKPGATGSDTDPPAPTVVPADGVHQKAPVIDVVPEPSSHVAASGLALTILATIAFVFALQWAKDFFIPLVLGILVSYTLNPVVVWLERMKVPRVLGTSLVMIGLIGGSGAIATSVYVEAQTMMDEVPFAAYKLSSAYKRLDNGELSTLDKLRSAADTLTRVTKPEAETPVDPAQPAPPAVVVAPPDFNLNDWLWAGSVSAAAFMGQMTMVLFMVFFALLSGNTFKRKLVRLTGPSLSNKKITVQILDDINTSIQKYMLMLLVTNTLLGIFTWLALWAIGMDNPASWGVVAGLLHIIPYFGPLIAAVVIGVAAFLQFDSLSMMLLAAAITLGVASIVGMLVTTWMTGRIAKMNATAVFVALLFGAWLWGVWGMLLCVPTIMVVKVISQHIEEMETIAELLGE